MSERFIRRGRGEPAVPLRRDSTIVRLPSCPDCQGRGWFLINPFEFRPAPAGGIGNMTQCLTCLDAHAYWQEHGHLPAELEPSKEGD
jgi:hypothetical protein